MTLARLKIIMYDSLKMPTLPIYSFQNRKRFLEASCGLWAVQEIYDMCRDGSYPSFEASIDEYMAMIRHFCSKMKKYARLDKVGAWRYEIAANMANELIDILEAMT